MEFSTNIIDLILHFVNSPYENERHDFCFTANSTVLMIRFRRDDERALSISMIMHRLV